MLMKKNNSEKDNRIGTPKVPQILSQNEPVRETACINTNSTLADSFAGYLNQWGNKLTMPAPEHSVEADISDEELNKQIFLYYEDCDLGNPYALEGGMHQNSRLNSYPDKPAWKQIKNYTLKQRSKQNFTCYLGKIQLMVQATLNLSWLA